jgi:hypothetical protein
MVVVLVVLAMLVVLLVLVVPSQQHHGLSPIGGIRMQTSWSGQLSTSL